MPGSRHWALTDVQDQLVETYQPEHHQPKDIPRNVWIKRPDDPSNACLLGSIVGPFQHSRLLSPALLFCRSEGGGLPRNCHGGQSSAPEATAIVERLYARPLLGGGYRATEIDLAANPLGAAPALCLADRLSPSPASWTSGPKGENLGAGGPGSRKGQTSSL
jgi:hypothetical protein